MVDVVISYEDADERAAATCAAAFGREGWSCFLSNRATAGRAPGARANLVIWTKGSVRSGRLAAENRAPLEKRCLLQVLLQPEAANPPDRVPTNRENVIEPPEPFCCHQGLPLSGRELDGTERAIDAFAQSGSTGHRLLQETARLGGLRRPCDTWNASIRFRKPLFSNRVEPVIVSEHAPADARLLRRDRIDDTSPIDTLYTTTIGNRWKVVSARRGDLVTEVLVVETEHEVLLAPRRRWWQRSKPG